ncbi:DUF3775 domain-containing protein [Pacificimonas sp. WHA3]|uniref:DUF3775 domain-containing protein n=1 Tax=Pacificimonas pallii TaxID=2827236 RepID=A0ABS6SEL5_9SPHN|nr:DUF3775 domain-containing protein [Pacificimonas pallii]MBV7256843.1 DUF3775 domain-containing protein [Pacificimonas pallii]
MELNISLNEVCRLVVRAREFDAQVPAVDPDDSSNMADDGAVGVLEDETNTSVEEEMRTFIDDLPEDEQVELYALMAVGRGDYDADEWDDALESITGEVSDFADELMETPALASLLEAGLAAFGMSCDGEGQLS